MASENFARLRISGWRQFQEIDLDIHPRLTIITGANGAGKSTLLSFFTRHFGYNKGYLATPQRTGAKNPFKVGLFVLRKLGFRKDPPPPQGPVFGHIDYSGGVSSALRLPTHSSLHYGIGIDNERPIDGLHIDSHRPPNIYRGVGTFPATPPPVVGIGDALNNEYMQYYSNGSVSYGSLYHIKMTLIQMSIYGHGNQTMEPIPALIKLFDGFERVLSIMLPQSLGFQKLIIRPPEVLLSTKSGDFLIDAASGGIIKLFEIAWQLHFYSQGRDGFVVTFDEPENHLHPSMQKSFLPNILKAFPNLQVIAVTHSPFIITAMRESTVYVLRYVDADIVGIEPDDDQSIRGMEGTRVIAEKLDTVNKAASASEILRDVLGITSTIPDWAEGRVHEVVARFRGQALNEAKLKEIYTELEKEGLASSYPTVLSSLTRPQ